VPKLQAKQKHKSDMEVVQVGLVHHLVHADFGRHNASAQINLINNYQKNI